MSIPLCLALAITALSLGCGGGPSAERAPGPQAPPRPQLFADRARDAGLDFSYWNGMTGRHYLLEVMGGGAALFDADGDGDLDLYLVQGAALDDGRRPLEPQAGPAGDRLYRNDLPAPGRGDRSPRFTDVTAAGGVRGHGYGMGVASGAYDNDGRVDLYVTNWGANRLLRNAGAGDGGPMRFVEVTGQTGTGDERWSVAAIFFDYDRDGWLDLYVGNYVDFRLEGHKTCAGFGATEDYCGPAAYPAQPDRLLRNLGPGASGEVRFEDVTARAGLHRERGPALGAVAADFDGDGWPDLYVANDQAENFLWRNRRDGTFDNLALVAGCALSGEGKAEASMGVAAADFDGDGDLDLVLTHLTGESHTLYANDGAGNFDDVTIRAGLDAGSRAVTGFGTAWLDFDRDGRLDLAVANGAVHRIEALHRQGDAYPLRQPNQLFRNLGGGAFEDAGARGGAAFEHAGVSRGVAAGDVDNDGDLDLVIVDSNGPLRLLIGSSPVDRHWLGLRLIGSTAGRDLLGALATLHRPSGPPLRRRVHTDGSYASASDPRLLFGLGEQAMVDRLEVLWPDGSAELFDPPPIDRYTTLRRGTGTPAR